MNAKRIIIVLLMMMICSVMQAQWSKNISFGYVPNGGSLLGNEVNSGYTFDIEKRREGGLGLTTSAGLLFGEFDKTKSKITIVVQDSTIESQTNYALFLNWGMEYVIDPKGRVQFPLGIELGLGYPLYHIGFSVTAKMRVYITDQLGAYIGARVTNLGVLYYINCGLVYSLNKLY